MNNASSNIPSMFKLYELDGNYIVFTVNCELNRRSLNVFLLESVDITMTVSCNYYIL